MAWLENAYPRLAALGLGHGPLLVCTDSQDNRVIQPAYQSTETMNPLGALMAQGAFTASMSFDAMTSPFFRVQRKASLQEASSSTESIKASDYGVELVMDWDTLLPTEMALDVSLIAGDLGGLFPHSDDQEGAIIGDEANCKERDGVRKAISQRLNRSVKNASGPFLLSLKQLKSVSAINRAWAKKRV